MGVNKVVTSSGITIIDISGVTVTPETLGAGITAFNAAGELIVGTAEIVVVDDSYVVDIEAVGYTEGARWSTSDGTIRTGATGCVAINLIEFERAAGEVLLIELSGINWQYNSNCTMALFADDAFKFGGYLNAASEVPNAGHDKILGENGAVTIRVYDNLQSAYDGINGIKVAGYGSASNAVIKISRETQDVSYTNQIYVSIDSSGAVFNGTGYKAGYRISTSSGNESAASGMTVTGFIWVPANGVVRVKDIDLTSGNSTYGVYNSDFTKDSSGYCNSLFGTADGDGVRSFTSDAGGKYYRFAGAFGDNPIITVDEEIS